MCEGRNIKINKVEVVRIEVKIFFFQTFKKYIFQVALLVAKKYYVSFSLWMLQLFVNQFIFNWGCE
jgi:hypothetical protein